MIGRVVEIAEDGRHLARSRGFLTVSAGGEEIGRVALDDVSAVVASAHGLTYSNNLLVALAERGVPLVVCGANHRPAAILWSADSHHDQAGRIAEQAAAGLQPGGAGTNGGNEFSGSGIERQPQQLFPMKAAMS